MGDSIRIGISGTINDSIVSRKDSFAIELTLCSLYPGYFYDKFRQSINHYRRMIDRESKRSICTEHNGRIAKDMPGIIHLYSSVAFISIILQEEL